MAQPLNFLFEDQIIEVPIPDTTLDLQYLVDQTRDTEDELHPGLAYSKIMDAFGKQSLGGGVFVGITVVLLDNWKIRFEARTEPTSVIVSGGNLIAESGNPIAPSDNVTVSIAQSTSPSIATPADNVNLKYLIASLAGAEGMHKMLGDVFYWDPYGGSDTNDGLTPTTGVETFTAALGLTTDNSYDAIYCLANDPSGITTVTTPITIPNTKNTVKVRGPGHVFRIIPEAAGSDTVTVEANNVEVSGLYLSTLDSGSDNAITVTGDRALIKDCWISNVRGHGINLVGSAQSRITTCAVEHCGTSSSGNGVNISTDTTQTNISKCVIFDSINGVNLSGTGIADNIIENSLIYKNSGYAINDGSGVLRTIGRDGNTLANNTSGTYPNSGTDTYIESAAGGISADEVANAVWGAAIADYPDAGTMGKTLRDAKTKATLASLK